MKILRTILDKRFSYAEFNGVHSFWPQTLLGYIVLEPQVSLGEIYFWPFHHVSAMSFCLECWQFIYMKEPTSADSITLVSYKHQKYYIQIIVTSDVSWGNLSSQSKI